MTSRHGVKEKHTGDRDPTSPISPCHTRSCRLLDVGEAHPLEDVELLLLRLVEQAARSHRPQVTVVVPELEVAQELDCVDADLRHEGHVGVAVAEADEQCRSDLAVGVVDVELGTGAELVVPVAPLAGVLAYFVTKHGALTGYVIALPGTAVVDPSTELLFAQHAFEDVEEAGDDSQVLGVALVECFRTGVVEREVDADGGLGEVGECGKHGVSPLVNLYGAYNQQFCKL